MAETNFVDYVKIYCRSGKGGRGSTHMRRVKYNPNGGPDGGNGGRGGHIILRGNRNYWTLLHLRYFFNASSPPNAPTMSVICMTEKHLSIMSALSCERYGLSACISLVALALSYFPLFVTAVGC